MGFLLIALAVWLAPALIIGLYLGMSLLRADRETARDASDEQGHASDDGRPEDGANPDDRQITSSLRAENAQVRSESHASPIA